MVSLFDLLSNDEREIVYSERGSSLVYTWNQSLTLQCWIAWPQGFEEVGIRTLSKEPSGFEEAREKAIEWDVEG